MSKEREDKKTGTLAEELQRWWEQEQGRCDCSSTGYQIMLADGLHYPIRVGRHGGVSVMNQAIVCAGVEAAIAARGWTWDFQNSIDPPTARVWHDAKIIGQGEAGSPALVLLLAFNEALRAKQDGVKHGTIRNGVVTHDESPYLPGSSVNANTRPLIVDVDQSIKARFEKIDAELDDLRLRTDGHDDDLQRHAGRIESLQQVIDRLYKIPPGSYSLEIRDLVMEAIRRVTELENAKPDHIDRRNIADLAKRLERVECSLNPHTPPDHAPSSFAAIVVKRLDMHCDRLDGLENAKPDPIDRCRIVGLLKRMNDAERAVAFLRGIANGAIRKGADGCWHEVYLPTMDAPDKSTSRRRWQHSDNLQTSPTRPAWPGLFWQSDDGTQYHHMGDGKPCVDCGKVPEPIGDSRLYFECNCEDDRPSPIRRWKRRWTFDAHHNGFMHAEQKWNGIVGAAVKKCPWCHQEPMLNHYTLYYQCGCEVD